MSIHMDNCSDVLAFPDDMTPVQRARAKSLRDGPVSRSTMCLMIAELEAAALAAAPQPEQKKEFVRKQCECGHSDQNHVPTCRYCICSGFVLDINAGELAAAAQQTGRLERAIEAVKTLIKTEAGHIAYFHDELNEVVEAALAEGRLAASSVPAATQENSKP